MESKKVVMDGAYFIVAERSSGTCQGGGYGGGGEEMPSG